MKAEPAESEFAAWVQEASAEGDRLLPLTHISSSLIAREIVKNGAIEPVRCEVMKDNVCYLFYARPAYRLSEGDVIKLESACPFCFIFDGEIIRQARECYAFDTGACERRLYNHILHQGFDYTNFSLGSLPDAPNRLIRRVFGDRISYFNADRTGIGAAEELAQPYQFEARAYLELIKSAGRNEPDDRISTIEVVFDAAIRVADNLKAIVVPHTLKLQGKTAPWISSLEQNGVDVVPYHFVPGRPPEHYHTLLEVAVLEYYKTKTII